MIYTVCWAALSNISSEVIFWYKWKKKFDGEPYNPGTHGKQPLKHRQYTRLHTFNGPLSGTTKVSRYQKGKTDLDFTEARDSEWQWHQLGRMQVCTSLQTDNHASTPPLSFFTGRMPFLPPNQQRQSTEGTVVSLITIYNQRMALYLTKHFDRNGTQCRSQ